MPGMLKEACGREAPSCLGEHGRQPAKRRKPQCLAPLLRQIRDAISCVGLRIVRQNLKAILLSFGAGSNPSARDRVGWREPLFVQLLLYALSCVGLPSVTDAPFRAAGWRSLHWHAWPDGFRCFRLRRRTASLCSRQIEQRSPKGRDDRLAPALGSPICARFSP
jgi:hypothetical protein